MSNVIYIYVDNDSWIIPYAKRLQSELKLEGYEVLYVQKYEEIGNGWINFMLGCTRLVSEEVLSRNTHNIVVHESDLPEGRGFAPMTWQILEGKNEIPVCLFEAKEKADAGVIWLRDTIHLKGNELCSEWRVLQGEKTIELCKKFVKSNNKLKSIEQSGQSTSFVRRYPKDSELDPNKSLADQFSLLRVVDNLSYPAYFKYKGRIFKITIEPIDAG